VLVPRSVFWRSQSVDPGSRSRTTAQELCRAIGSRTRENGCPNRSNMICIVNAIVNTEIRFSGVRSMGVVVV